MTDKDKKNYFVVNKPETTNAQPSIENGTKIITDSKKVDGERRIRG